jgi:serine/threonine protein phosphatase PrpC
MQEDLSSFNRSFQCSIPSCKNNAYIQQENKLYCYLHRIEKKMIDEEVKNDKNIKDSLYKQMVDFKLKHSATINVETFSHSDQWKRDKMEDFLLHTSFKNSVGETFYIGMVADGHVKDTCANFIITSLSAAIIHEFKTIKEAVNNQQLSIRKRLRNVILSISQKWDILSARIGDDSGSTLVGYLINDVLKKIWVFNVGDSRCIISNPETAEILFITRDHKPDNPIEIERINVLSSKIKKKITITHNQNDVARLEGYLAMSRSFGDRRPEMEDKIDRTPDIFELDIQMSCAIFLSSDGILDVISNQTICEIIRNHYHHPTRRNEVAQEIVEFAKTSKNCMDNLSTIISFIEIK